MRTILRLLWNVRTSNMRVFSHSFAGIERRKRGYWVPICWSYAEGESLKGLHPRIGGDCSKGRGCRTIKLLASASGQNRNVGSEPARQQRSYPTAENIQAEGRARVLHRDSRPFYLRPVPPLRFAARVGIARMNSMA